jgi:pimeloyl-ACP methyl ester carboxylesterase
MGLDQTMPEFQTLTVGERRIRIASQGTGPLVLMVHGFPESWYSWRHQMAPLAAAGYRAVAMDVRGYGGSSKPHAIEAYDMQTLVGDIAGLIEVLSPNEKAVLIGHDWGAPQVWNTALIRPDRVRAVCGLSVPYLGVPQASFSDLIEAVFTSQGKFFYQYYFQKSPQAENDLEGNLRSFLRKFYYAISGDAPDGTWPNNKPVEATLLEGLVDPDPFPAWLTPQDLEYYVTEFEVSGLRGPLNRYRNHDRDFAYLRQFEGRLIEQPALFIGGQRDLVLSMFGNIDLLAAMRTQIPDLRGADILPGCGHWTQQEQPEAVNSRILNWLATL